MQAPTGAALVRAQRTLESYDVAPGGDWLAYAVREVRADRYRSHLWQVPWRGGRPRRLTDGAVRDGSPAIAPDGARVAFTRSAVADDAAEAQVWILEVAERRAWQLTRLPHGAGTPRWSPDGRRLAVLGAAGPHRFAVGPERPGKPPRARRMTRTDFRDDESGFLGRRTHLFVLPVREGARARQLTRGDFDVADPTWAPDGRWLAFSADIGPDWNILPRSEIFRVSVRGGPMQPLVSLRGDATRPAISPDGRRVAFIGTDVDDPPDETNDDLWVARVSGGRPRPLCARLDRSTTTGAWADLVLVEDVPGPIWLDDERLAVLVGDRGRNVPHVVSLRGEVRPLVDPGRVVGGGLAFGGGHLALSAGVDRHGAELHAVEGWEDGLGSLRRLTDAGAGWQRRFPIPDWDEVWVPGPGGPIQTWVISPPGARRRRLPTILIFHGGPTGCHAPGGTMDSTMLAGHGFRVVHPNIRGSATFGSAWVAALGGRWGEVDTADVLAVVDHLVAAGLTDQGRLGMMGLSYGGYLVQWLAGATDRFAAGVAENGVTNELSAWGQSYFGVHYNRRARLGDPLTDDGAAQLWAHSPLRIARDIHTPLLILQAEEDRICTPADNEQLFTALKVLDREVEYILYPEEHHEMKNYGRPDRRIDRMERILDWFTRHLGAPAAAGRVRRATSG